MIELASDTLRVSVLDPEHDQARLGSRYVAGGYVWQVSDTVHGPLLSGPCFPDAEPPPFHGQGLPEVFEIALDQDRARVGDDVYVIGVGRVRRDSANKPFHVRDNPVVTEHAVWQQTYSEEALNAVTRATFGDFAFKLSRNLELDERTLTSSTLVENHGVRRLPVRWFAHPFFPFGDGACCRLSLEHALPDGAAFVEDENGFVARRSGIAWQSGHYVVPRVALGGALVVEQWHPTLGRVSVECRFPLGWLALWSNDRTFSFEPFFQTVIEPGHAARWSIAYRF